MTLVVSAMLRAKAGKEQRLREVLAEVSVPSRAEPGNRFYQAHQSVDDPQRFFVYEQYADEASYRAHQESEHYTRLIKGEAAPELIADREIALFETIDANPPANA